ncbi:hypothetical protein E8E78_19785 [Pseudomonas sp. BN505]|nr:hypothetical protein [Pseudomonas sp. BN605]MDH4858814.1 hypothetical protein [Pseudomonas sp. BN505]
MGTPPAPGHSTAQEQRYQRITCLPGVGGSSCPFSTSLTGVFAGSPAPTGTGQLRSLWGSCGSGQAREKASTATAYTQVTHQFPQKSVTQPFRRNSSRGVR